MLMEEAGKFHGQLFDGMPEAGIFCWNLPVLGAFMTNCTTHTFLHSESIWINLQLSISVLF